MRSAVSPSEDGYERKIVFFIRPAAWRLMRRPTLLRPDDVRYRRRAELGTIGGPAEYRHTRRGPYAARAGHWTDLLMRVDTINRDSRAGHRSVADVVLSRRVGKPLDGTNRPWTPHRAA